MTIAGGSLTSSGPMALNGGLTMSGGLITGAGDFTLGGTSLWTGGPITGTGSMAVNAGERSPSIARVSGVLGRNIVNFGTVIWNQASLTLSGLTIANNVGGCSRSKPTLRFRMAGSPTRAGCSSPVPLALTLSNVQFNTTGSLRFADRRRDAVRRDSVRRRWLSQRHAERGFARRLRPQRRDGVQRPDVRRANEQHVFNDQWQRAGYTANYTATGLTLVAEQDAIVLSLVDTTLVGVGRQATLSVTLPFAAPPGGVTAAVTSLNTNLLTVASPGTIAFAQGQTVGQIQVNGVQPGSVTVTAAAPGYTTGQLSVSVTQNLISTPGALTVAFGATNSLPVNIGPSPAPPGGLTLSVVSANPAVIEVVTPTITVPEGALSANATVRGLQIGSALVTVSNPQYSPSTTNVTSSAELNIVQVSASFHNGLPPPVLTSRVSRAAARLSPRSRR